jgi:hypothetical protein
MIISLQAQEIIVPADIANCGTIALMSVSNIDRR